MDHRGAGPPSGTVRGTSRRIASRKVVDVFSGVPPNFLQTASGHMQALVSRDDGLKDGRNRAALPQGQEASEELFPQEEVKEQQQVQLARKYLRRVEPVCVARLERCDVVAAGSGVASLPGAMSPASADYRRHCVKRAGD